MAAAAELEFVVGENYENEKGIFTVVSMGRNEMVIRWESGEEISTDIELQRNIQARRLWEELQVENEAKAAKSGGVKAGSKARPEFDGFQAADFKNSASGTRWRGRAQLGGAVTRKLPADRYRFNSWALGNKPELHWLDMKHQQREGEDNGIRFVTRVDRMSLYYGFAIIRPDGRDGVSQDWDTFTKWIDHDESEKLLRELALAQDLTLYERTTSSKTVLLPQDDGWRADDVQYKKAFEFISQLPPTGPLQVEVAKRIDKIDAVARGKDLADEIAALYAELMPVYQAVVDRLV